MSLPDWERNGWLTKHLTSQNEIRDLLQVVERDLADSAAEGLSADWRMNIAYNERVGLVSDADVDAMRALAVKLRNDVVAWIEEHHAALLRE